MFRSKKAEHLRGTCHEIHNQALHICRLFSDTAFLLYRYPQIRIFIGHKHIETHLTHPASRYQHSRIISHFIPILTSTDTHHFHVPSIFTECIVIEWEAYANFAHQLVDHLSRNLQSAGLTWNADGYGGEYNKTRTAYLGTEVSLSPPMMDLFSIVMRMISCWTPDMLAQARHRSSRQAATGLLVVSQIRLSSKNYGNVPQSSLAMS